MKLTLTMIQNWVITFVTASTEPDRVRQDNVENTYRKVVSGYADRILKYTLCTLLCVFDNRVFFSRNQGYPDVVWHSSSLDDPEYLNDLNYYNKGLDLAKVKEFVAGNTFTSNLNRFLPCTYYWFTIWNIQEYLQVI